MRREDLSNKSWGKGREESKKDQTERHKEITRAWYHGSLGRRELKKKQNKKEVVDKVSCFRKTNSYPKSVLWI